MEIIPEARAEAGGGEIWVAAVLVYLCVGTYIFSNGSEQSRRVGQAGDLDIECALWTWLFWFTLSVSQAGTVARKFVRPR